MLLGHRWLLLGLVLVGSSSHAWLLTIANLLLQQAELHLEVLLVDVLRKWSLLLLCLLRCLILLLLQLLLLELL